MQFCTLCPVQYAPEIEMLNSLCYNSQSNLFCIWNAMCNHPKTVLLINYFFKNHDLSKIRWRVKKGEGNIHIVNLRQLEAWEMTNLYSVTSQWGAIGGLIGSVGQLGCSCSMDSQCPLQFCKEQLFPSLWNIKWKSLFSLTLYMHFGGSSRLYFNCKIFPQELEIKE